MARLQATIDDKVMAILNKLLRRNDRARFIELAIKYAVNDPNIYNLFAWQNNISHSETAKESTHLVDKKKKIEFDSEF